MKILLGSHCTKLLLRNASEINLSLTSHAASVTLGNMKKKRLLLIAGFLAACIGGPLIVAALMPPMPGVTKANFDRIEVGISREQVEAVLGKPGLLWLETDKLRYRVWHSDDGSVALIMFERDDQAESVLPNQKWIPS